MQPRTIVSSPAAPLQHRSARLSAHRPAAANWHEPAARRAAGLDLLLAAATTSVLVMSTRPGGEPIGTLGRVDRDNVRRGVRYRFLGPDTARLSGALGSIALAGAEVRTAVEVPMDALIIDGATAVLPAEGTAGVAVFRLPSVVTATAELAERIWRDAVPLASVDLPDDDTVLTARERRLLTLLCSGSTDESAAAALEVSVRTVRRTVADIMNRLGARSRFQAGVKAADRGWLLDLAG